MANKATLKDLFPAWWEDDSLKARFIEDPRKVLSEFGLELPESVEPKVYETSDDFYDSDGTFFPILVFEGIAD